MTSQGPQPPKTAAYASSSNPVDSTPAESASSARSTGGVPRQKVTTARRGPDSQDPKAQGTPAYSLGVGVRSSGGPVNAREAGATDTRASAADSRQNANVDAEQMATLSEGKVADAVERKSGTQRFGDQEVRIDDYAAGIER